MDTVIDKAKKQVIIKIDVTAGKMGNLLELMEQVSPSHGRFNCIVSTMVRPESWPEIMGNCSGISIGISLEFCTFMDQDCRRYLDILINKFTGQYEIIRNDFRAMEVSELELVVWRDMVD